ncbi:hypothetical protein FAM21823_02554 [Lentilactobacillus parabuchneri]|uniref:DUF1304 domain-containing protein n=1 Tax=Lentilactobacillus TaxID=2767893 RepID=UPI000A0FA5B3|nr:MULTISPECIES: DUF1304 domain-containing protein [Lentilactobacillus]MDV3517898.1 DUF1304 domain-containing protein [Lentilactobacillus otakiensis]ORM97828.1 hypothetical protein FAM21823_02554 [Lentilactobacillus parabuchneri]
MIILKDIFVIFVAVEALLIMLLEMLGTQTKIARNAFDLSKKYLAIKEARMSMANQGLYNGFVGVGIVYARYGLTGMASLHVQVLFIGFVVIAALFGSVTANKKIIFTQGGPALFALGFLLFVN